MPSRKIEIGIGKKNSLEKSNKSLQQLDKQSLVRELTGRGIYQGDKKNELFGFEPLHDIGKHIENALTELPANIPQQEAFELNTIIELPIGGRETKRTVDYRCTLVLAASQVRGKINSKAQLLLDTLAKIQEIAYGSCWKR